VYLINVLRIEAFKKYIFSLKSLKSVMRYSFARPYF